ncbi:lipopolysaccharide kinase InaA family protein [Parahaliea mediterranea]|uniref:lipopolysaccharide kinase InaA family protein n=1 Tax=Parahaliea mediterranea TaxID=651086 RepID=UPI0013005BA2|nr:lipopolysaccharide kinase InaA family protein [Parahaliea mediterranea]
MLLAGDEVPEGWEVVASSPYARVAREASLGVFYKAFLPRTPLERLKGLLRGSRARRARLQSDALNHAGFTAPENLAWGRLGGGREYLFSRAVPGEGITHWLRHGLSGRDAATLVLRRNLLRELGTYIGRLHATGFIHGDLRTSNVLANYKGGQFRFALIDNERNLRRRPPPGKLVLKNLMQLNMLLPSDLTRTDRWRFFQAWRRQHPELGHLEARILATESYRWAMRRLRAKGKV